MGRIEDELTVREDCLNFAKNKLDAWFCTDSWQVTQFNKVIAVILVLAILFGIGYALYRLTRKTK